jgi:hypothetical protein
VANTNSNECWMTVEPFYHCCCQCAYHLEDHLHCSHDRRLTFDISTLEEEKGCICHIQRGWICAAPEMYPEANSNWPEHSIGCECFVNRDRKK